ncbi:MAG TPA: O-acetyl-ADP-ribose deacetylase [Acidobacteriota bacterium]|nr:O-acetyl-ADP-ribose deacetylase [Acidobacteriota bacterium]
MEERRIGGGAIRVAMGDLTQFACDAVVNAANSALAGGGGLDGAIHRRGGPRIMEECRRIGGCPTGKAVATTAGELPARWVVHAVGPVYNGGAHGEPALLASAYRSALAVADGLGAAHVALPAISAGVYGYPLAEAAAIAVEQAIGFLRQGPRAVAEITFVLLGEAPYRAFKEALARAASAL